MPSGTDANKERLDSLKPWFRKAGAMLCLCSVLFASGFHTVALQTYGWAKMYDAYSESVPSAEALEMTFSGVELCGVCVISQETLQDMENSLELSLSEKTPLVQFTISQLDIVQPEGQSATDGIVPLKVYQEIRLANEPPPPRCA